MASKKAIRNRVRAVAKKARIKRLNFQPVIKNVDIEEMKAGFGSKPAKKAAPKKEEATADKAEVKEKAAPKAEAKKEEGKAEKKEAAPKAEAKAAEDKKEDKQPAKEEKAS